MATSKREQDLLEGLVAAEDVAFTAEDRSALVDAGIPIGCVLKCLATLARCGLDKPECWLEFATCTLACTRK